MAIYILHIECIFIYTILESFNGFTKTHKLSDITSLIAADDDDAVLIFIIKPVTGVFQFFILSNSLKFKGKKKN